MPHSARSPAPHRPWLSDHLRRSRICAVAVRADRFTFRRLQTTAIFGVGQDLIVDGPILPRFGRQSISLGAEPREFWPHIPPGARLGAFLPGRLMRTSSRRQPSRQRAACPRHPNTELSGSRKRQCGDTEALSDRLGVEFRVAPFLFETPSRPGLLPGSSIPNHLRSRSPDQRAPSASPSTGFLRSPSPGWTAASRSESEVLSPR